ncbi:MAG: ATP-binding protein, partial [Anaerolineae bacterium]|nr:ATP-binding protein [Anaerolineae bacterium]
MIIESVRVLNFRCIKDETLLCYELTALVGPNGSGKSSFLRALEIFYTHNSRYTEDDFYDRNTNEPILITVTYSQLGKEEKELFKNRMKGDVLTVEKELRWPPGGGSQKYYGASLQSPDFKKCQMATSAAELREAYDELRESEKYAELPAYTNRATAEQALKDWEAAHPDQCSLLRDQGQFFGFTGVGGYNLERNTRFLFVPAVREASEDAAERRGSVLTELMDLVVRSVLAQREEVKQLQEDAQARYDEIMDPANLTELQTLESDLSATLRTYVPDAGVKLTWLKGDPIQVPMPRADTRLLEDEYPSPVDRTGHGLQRAFILTMLQHLAVAQAPMQERSTEEQVVSSDASRAKSVVKMPNLIIGVEEPELYQHPNRQRHLSNILFNLAAGNIKGVAERTQIIYSTHSPLFVDIKRFKNTRVLRKIRKQQD